jgi:hypothetical protein
MNRNYVIFLSKKNIFYPVVSNDIVRDAGLVLSPPLFFRLHKATFKLTGGIFKPWLTFLNGHPLHLFPAKNFYVARFLGVRKLASQQENSGLRDIFRSLFTHILPTARHLFLSQPELHHETGSFKPECRQALGYKKSCTCEQ